MKKSRFTYSQIMAVLKETEAGVAAPELYRTHGISTATFYNRRTTFGGMDVPLIARIKELEEENWRLKKTYAEAQLSTDISREALAKNGEAIAASRDGPAGGRDEAHHHCSRLHDVCDQ